jgi:plastocyanin
MTDGYNGSVFWLPTVTVPVGATVLWTNNDSLNPHTVTSDTGLFDSVSLTEMDESALPFQDASFSYTFTERGTFKYHCSIHPWMVGEVVVE